MGGGAEDSNARYAPMRTFNRISRRLLFRFLFLGCQKMQNEPPRNCKSGGYQQWNE